MSSDAEPGERTVLSYLAAFNRRRIPALACIAVALLAAAVYSITQTPRYEASAQVALSRQNLANALTNTPDPNQSANDFLRIVTTRAKLGRSPTVAQRVVAAAPDLRLSTTDFLDISDVTPVEDADILRFSVNSKSRANALRLSNIYADQFVAYLRQIDTQSLRRALGQLTERLSTLRATSGTSQQLINQLASKEQEIRTLEALQTANATVVARALEAVKVAPTPKRSLAVALVLGLCLAFVVVLGLEAVDTRVKNAKDIEDELAYPQLGDLPKPSSALEGRLLTLESPHDPDVEAFRILRTNLDFATVDIEKPTILVTSSIPREGKTTTISNLAVTIARAGLRVTLVDLDLRQPTVHARFGVSQHPGITDLVRGTHTIDDVSRSVDIGGSNVIDATATPGDLRIVTAGTRPPDPGELMRRRSLHEVLRALKDRSDVVLIDAPPTLLVGDAMALSPVVDGVFVVVRLSQVRRGALHELRRSLERSPAPTLGFVVTGASSGGQYGYGYGYGYGSTPAPPESNDQ